MDTDALLAEIRDELRALYGERLEGVVLYGSTARGEAGEDSDIDILVLLSPPLDYGRELAKLVGTLYPLSLKWGRPISPEPALTSDYEEARYPLYRAAKRDGVLL